MRPGRGIDIRFKGKSGQGRTVKFRTNDAGLMERFAISWRGDCRRPGFAYIDVGGYRERLSGRGLAVYHARTGRCHARRGWRVLRIPG